jgi:hypothetical protein
VKFNVERHNHFRESADAMLRAAVGCGERDVRLGRASAIDAADIPAAVGHYNHACVRCARGAAGQSEKTSAVRYVRTQTSPDNPPVLSEEPETVAP